jgi:hypothetical protein
MHYISFGIFACKILDCLNFETCIKFVQNLLISKKLNSRFHYNLKQFLIENGLLKTYLQMEQSVEIIGACKL